ncbi:MAG: Protein saal1 [Marteilia pararefringens]
MSDDVRDSIGSSVFSKTFVVNTLHSTLESAKNKLNSCTKRGFDLPRIDDFTDLCHLWDISSNYDVCKFLKDSGNLEDIEILLSLGLSARLNEILFGIVGNMACYPEFVDEIYRSISLKDHIDNCLIYVDAEMIHQLLRIVYAFCRTNDSSGQKELLVKHLKEPLIYILKNSSNRNYLYSSYL